MKKDEIKAVIFDMDGLMFDTERLTSSMWHKICDLYGYDFTDEFWVSLTGSNNEAFKVAFIERFGIDFDYDKKRAERWEIEENYIEANGLPIKEGLYQLLKYLKNNQIKTAVATSRVEKKALNWLKLANVEQYFDVKVFGDAVKNSKPEPDIFLKTIELLEVKADECIVLEDSFNGIIAANRAKTKPIMVPDLRQPDQEIEKLLYAKCDSLNDVQRMLVLMKEEKLNCSQDG